MDYTISRYTFPQFFAGFRPLYRSAGLSCFSGFSALTSLVSASLISVSSRAMISSPILPSIRPCSSSAAAALEPRATGVSERLPRDCTFIFFTAPCPATAMILLSNRSLSTESSAAHAGLSVATVRTPLASLVGRLCSAILSPAKWVQLTTRRSRVCLPRFCPCTFRLEIMLPMASGPLNRHLSAVHHEDRVPGSRQRARELCRRYYRLALGSHLRQDAGPPLFVQLGEDVVQQQDGHLPGLLVQVFLLCHP